LVVEAVQAFDRAARHDGFTEDSQTKGSRRPVTETAVG
jgi:hypothetical protein